MAPEGSRLQSMFCGRWEDSLPRDEQTRIFLDFTPMLFETVLSYLRTLALAPPGVSVGLPSVEAEHRQEFYMMMRFLGLSVAELPLAMKAYHGNMIVSDNGRRLQASANTANQCIAVAVGCAAIGCFESLVWKVTVEALPVSGWLGIGVISTEKPQLDSYRDPSSYTWTGQTQGGGRVMAAGQETISSWSGWAQGDVALFKFNAAGGSLHMHHARLMRCFEFPRIPAGDWRLHVALRASTVLLSEAAANEAALMA
ncbi:unnamed protein product [Effrenium voratum]|nr:unnamed protein product [Effrenium voratum]